MKKYSIYALLFVITLIFSNCEEQENIQFDSINGQTLVKFTSSAATLAVQPTGISTQEILVEVSTLSDTDRTITLEVDEASTTATSNQYVITDIVIPAGAYSGSGSITGIYDNIPNSGSVTLAVEITGISNTDNPAIDNPIFTLTLERFCPLDVQDFLGTYTALGSFNDPDNLTARPDIVITAGPVANTIRLTNVHANGRQMVLEMDYSDVTAPKLINRSFEFGAVFQTTPNYTIFRDQDQANNTFNTCQSTITLRFYRTTNGTGVTSGGEYNYILTKQ